MMMNSKVLITLLILTISSLASGCSTTLPAESPICVPLRPVLSDIAVSDQRAMKAAAPEGFANASTNDAKLKSHLRLLEGTIHAHDEPLGECD
jgi:hypothetical protein